jgi:uncharacterized FlaG/YvyC family protein
MSSEDHRAKNAAFAGPKRSRSKSEEELVEAEATVPSIVDLCEANFMDALRPVVYDFEDMRFVNNANSERRFALHVHCKDIVVDVVSVQESDGVIIARIPSKFIVPLLQIEEKLVDIINNTPRFSDEDESDEVLVLTSKSFLRVNSSGDASIRMEIDGESENRSLFFDKNSEGEEEPLEISPEKLKRGFILDAVVQVIVDVDDDRREAIFTAVVEESSVTQPAPTASKPKRKPTILKSSSHKDRR